MKKNNNVINVALCEGRHEIPQATDGCIFKTISDVTAVDAMEIRAFHSTWNICYTKEFTRVDPNWDGCDCTPLMLHDVHVNLYVTGLTVALIAFLNAMRKEDVTITLWHYNKESDSYYPQEVL